MYLFPLKTSVFLLTERNRAHSLLLHLSTTSPTQRTARQERHWADCVFQPSSKIFQRCSFPLNVSVNFAKYFQRNHVVHKPGAAGIIPAHKLSESTDCAFIVSLAFLSPVKSDTSYTHRKLLFPLFVALTLGRVWQRCRRQQQNKTTSGAPLSTRQVIHRREFMDCIEEGCFYKHPSTKILIYF